MLSSMYCLFDLPYVMELPQEEAPGDTQGTFICGRGCIPVLATTVPFTSFIYSALFGEFIRRQISTAYSV